MVAVDGVLGLAGSTGWKVGRLHAGHYPKIKEPISASQEGRDHQIPTLPVCTENQILQYWW
jgi:hypothetical protein